MSKRDWKLFIEDILESIGLIENYVADMDIEDFKKGILENFVEQKANMDAYNILRRLGFDIIER